MFWQLFLSYLQVGAFSVKENAEAYLQKVHEVLPEAFIVVG